MIDAINVCDGTGENDVRNDCARVYYSYSVIVSVARLEAAATTHSPFDDYYRTFEQMHEKMLSLVDQGNCLSHLPYCFSLGRIIIHLPLAFHDVFQHLLQQWTRLAHHSCYSGGSFFSEMN